MEKMIRYIETLLKRHDYVIVPGFGGFAFHHQSAVILNDSIEPPAVKVSFNPLMNTSDGLLAIEISRMEGLSFREASGMIAEEVDKLKHALKNKGNVEFGRIGFLKTDEEGKTIFTPSQNTHMLPANYGLSTLHYIAAQQQETERRVITFTLPPARKIIRYAAIGVVAVGLFFAAPNLNNTAKNLANLWPARQLNPTPEITESVQPLMIAIPYTQEVSEASAQTEILSHHVIISCMASRRNADNLCDWLKRSDYTKAHILSSTRIYRVVIESFATKEEAIVYMQQLRASTPQFADAWVLSE